MSRGLGKLQRRIIDLAEARKRKLWTELNPEISSRDLVKALATLPGGSSQSFRESLRRALAGLEKSGRLRREKRREGRCKRSYYSVILVPEQETKHDFARAARARDAAAKLKAEKNRPAPALAPPALPPPARIVVTGVLKAPKSDAQLAAVEAFSVADPPAPRDGRKREALRPPVIPNT